MWKDVLPFCVVNSILCSVIYVLKKEDIVNLSIMGGGHKVLATLVAFLVVQRLRTSYTNFWAARTQFSYMLQNARLVAIDASSFSIHDRSAKATEWRNLVGVHLINYLQSTVEILTEPKNTVDLVHCRKESLEISPRDNPMENVTHVQAAISLHKKYLKQPFKVHKELYLNQYLLASVNHYRELTVYSSTPSPFPFSQLTRIFILIWIFTMPFALIYEFEPKEYAAPFAIFLITYGYFGLGKSGLAAVFS